MLIHKHAFIGQKAVEYTETHDKNTAHGWLET